MAKRIRRLIDTYPTFGYRRLWAMLRHKQGLDVNRKKVYRILKLKGWFVNQRSQTPRPRAQKRRSATNASDLRWAMYVTLMKCVSYCWAIIAAVIDC